MTDSSLIPSDFVDFPAADIARAGKLLGCPLDEASCMKALIYQRDTGLSIARGEISIVPFGGKPTVMVNKQGYLAYAAGQPDYDGYDSGIETVNGQVYAWAVVYSKTRSHPTKVRISQKEFGKSTPVWKTMPEYMLEKTAISLALRAAFPIGLNGTYSEDEIDTQPYRAEPQPYKVVVQPTDIKVEPEAPKAAEPATPALPDEKDQYTQAHAQMVLENMTEKGMNIDIFNKARLPNGNYDKRMIEADFRAQLAEMKKAKEIQATENKPQVNVEKPAEPEKNYVCMNCGEAISRVQWETSQMIAGKHLCMKCLNQTHKA